MCHANIPHNHSFTWSTLVLHDNSFIAYKGLIKSNCHYFLVCTAVTLVSWNARRMLPKDASTQRMFSLFSSDDQLWMNVCQHSHLFSFLHSAICEINWDREKINKLNGEEWRNYIPTIHHHLMRSTSNRLRMNGWSSSYAHYIQLRLIIQSEQADHPRVDAP